MAEAESHRHDWRRQPHLTEIRGHYQAVCLHCWAIGLVGAEVPVWTDADYYAHQREAEALLDRYFVDEE